MICRSVGSRLGVKHRQLFESDLEAIHDESNQLWILSFYIKLTTFLNKANIQAGILQVNTKH